MLHDPFFYAFVATALVLGWVVANVHGMAKGLYQIIQQLDLERDAQARTIQWQRHVIAELEKEKEKGKAETPVTMYTCIWCEVRHRADDAEFWEKHKEVHPGKFGKVVS